MGSRRTHRLLWPPLLEAEGSGEPTSGPASAFYEDKKEIKEVLLI